MVTGHFFLVEKKKETVTDISKQGGQKKKIGEYLFKFQICLLLLNDADMAEPNWNLPFVKIYSQWSIKLIFPLVLDIGHFHFIHFSTPYHQQNSFN